MWSSVARWPKNASKNGESSKQTKICKDFCRFLFWHGRCTWIRSQIRTYLEIQEVVQPCMWKPRKAISQHFWNPKPIYWFWKKQLPSNLQGQVFMSGEKFWKNPPSWSTRMVESQSMTSRQHQQHDESDDSLVDGMEDHELTCWNWDLCLGKTDWRTNGTINDAYLKKPFAE